MSLLNSVAEQATTPQDSHESVHRKIDPTVEELSRCTKSKLIDEMRQLEFELHSKITVFDDKKALMRFQKSVLVDISRQFLHMLQKFIDVQSAEIEINVSNVSMEDTPDLVTTFTFAEMVPTTIFLTQEPSRPYQEFFIKAEGDKAISLKTGREEQLPFYTKVIVLQDQQPKDFYHPNALKLFTEAAPAEQATEDTQYFFLCEEHAEVFTKDGFCLYCKKYGGEQHLKLPLDTESFIYIEPEKESRSFFCSATCEGRMKPIGYVKGEKLFKVFQCDECGEVWGQPCGTYDYAGPGYGEREAYNPDPRTQIAEVTEAYNHHISQHHNADFEVCGDLTCILARKLEQATDLSFSKSFVRAKEQGWIMFGIENYRGWQESCECEACETQRHIYNYLNQPPTAAPEVARCKDLRGNDGDSPVETCCECGIEGNNKQWLMHDDGDCFAAMCPDCQMKHPCDICFEAGGLLRVVEENWVCENCDIVLITAGAKLEC